MNLVKYSTVQKRASFPEISAGLCHLFCSFPFLALRYGKFISDEGKWKLPPVINETDYNRLLQLVCTRASCVGKSRPKDDVRHEQTVKPLLDQKNIAGKIIIEGTLDVLHKRANLIFHCAWRRIYALPMIPKRERKLVLDSHVWAKNRQQQQFLTTIRILHPVSIGKYEMPMICFITWSWD